MDGEVNDDSATLLILFSYQAGWMSIRMTMLILIISVRDSKNRNADPDGHKDGLDHLECDDDDHEAASMAHFSV